MRVKVHIGKLVRYCSGVQHHAWYETNVGVIRKPIQRKLPDNFQPSFHKKKEEIVKLSWWKRLVLFIKKILKW